MSKHDVFEQLQKFATFPCRETANNPQLETGLKMLNWAKMY